MEVFRALFIHLEDIRVLFFSHLVQANLVVFTGLALVGVRLSLRQVFAVGIPVAFYVYLERALMLTYQYAMTAHLILGVLGFILAIRLILRLPIVTAVIATVISYLILLASETFFLIPVITYFNIDLKYMVSNPWLQCALGLLSNIPLLVIGGVAYFARFSLLRLYGGGRGGLGKISDVGVRKTLH